MFVILLSSVQTAISVWPNLLPLFFSLFTALLNPIETLSLYGFVCNPYTMCSLSLSHCVCVSSVQLVCMTEPVAYFNV